MVASATPNRYKVIVAAEINATQIQAALDKLTGKYKINLDVQLNTADLQKVGDAIEKVKRKIISEKNIIKESIFFNADVEQQTMDSIESRVAEIRNSIDSLAQFRVNKSVDLEGEEKITSAVFTYTDQAGKAVQETMAWNTQMKELGLTTDKTTMQLEKINTWATTSINYSDNIAKVNAELERASFAADKMAQKLKGKDLLPGFEGASQALERYTNAINSGDIENVRKYGKELKLATDEMSRLISVENQLANATDVVNNAMAKLKGRKSAPEVENLRAKAVETSEAIKLATSQPTPQNLQRMNDLTKQTKDLGTVMGNSGKDTLSFSKAFKIALERITQWGLATAVIYGSLRQLKEGIQYVKDLNKALTDVQVVSGQSSEKVSMLADSYNKLARELGATTLEIADSSLTWVRQGKTIEESFTLTKNAMILSKLANIESAQSSEYLTSIMLGFKMEVGETVDAIDKLIAVDNASATSAAELAEAISRTANIAQMAGVSFSDLSAYIGTVSSVSRKSAESIGESFKTIFTRLQNVKLGKIDDESGESLSNVEEALGRVNIKLRENETTFRDMSDVLEEVAGRWSTFDDVTKASIAQAIAGKVLCQNI